MANVAAEIASCQKMAQEGKISEALTSLQKFCSVNDLNDKEKSLLTAMRAKLFHLDNRLSDAIFACEAFFDFEPDTKQQREIRVIHARCCMKLGRYEQATFSWKKVIKDEDYDIQNRKIYQLENAICKRHIELETKDHFKILKVARDATTAQIQTSHRNLLREWHPDRNQHREDEAHKMSQQLNQARSTIGEESSRRDHIKELEQIKRDLEALQKELQKEITRDKKTQSFSSTNFGFQQPSSTSSSSPSGFSKSGAQSTFSPNNSGSQPSPSPTGFSKSGAQSPFSPNNSGSQPSSSPSGFSKSGAQPPFSGFKSPSQSPSGFSKSGAQSPFSPNNSGSQPSSSPSGFSKSGAQPPFSPNNSGSQPSSSPSGFSKPLFSGFKSPSQSQSSAPSSSSSNDHTPKDSFSSRQSPSASGSTEPDIERLVSEAGKMSLNSDVVVKCVCYKPLDSQCVYYQKWPVKGFECQLKLSSQEGVKIILHDLNQVFYRTNSSDTRLLSIAGSLSHFVLLQMKSSDSKLEDLGIVIFDKQSQTSFWGFFSRLSVSRFDSVSESDFAVQIQGSKSHHFAAQSEGSKSHHFAAQSEGSKSHHFAAQSEGSKPRQEDIRRREKPLGWIISFTGQHVYHPKHWCHYLDGKLRIAVFKSDLEAAPVRIRACKVCRD